MPRSVIDRLRLDALVAYLNRRGNQESASTDLMIPTQYRNKKQPYTLDVQTWTAGRKVYLEHCLTCHGCAGTGDGPYAYLNNARPADFRQPRFKGLDPSFDFWRISQGVPGTVMPQWEQTLTEKERWQVIAFIQGAFMDMVPHFTDEGDMPAKYALTEDPIIRSDETIDAGKAIFVLNCAFCHGYGGRGDGPDARGLLPAPPDLHERDTYIAWTPQDFFWRVSESIPMRAMPQWKYWFDEQQRWLVAEYVRNVLVLLTAPSPSIRRSRSGPKASSSPRRERRARPRSLPGADVTAMLARGARQSPVRRNFTDADLDTMPDDYFLVGHRRYHNAAMPQWGCA
jgi:mono/diheme cytochrome c family protein